MGHDPLTRESPMTVTLRAGEEIVSNAVTTLRRCFQVIRGTVDLLGRAVNPQMPLQGFPRLETPKFCYASPMLVCKWYAGEVLLLAKYTEEH